MSVIQAGNTTTTSLIYTGDTTGNLVFTTGGANTVALTLSNTQAATFANNVSIAGITTLTGATTLSNTATATAFIPSGSTAPTNGIYLPSANNVGIATNSISRFQINSSGAVTKPYQPAFIATGDQGSITITPSANIPFNTLVSSMVGSTRNSGYNTGTYAYTAPVTGLYAFYAQIYISSSGFSLAWLKNGSQLLYTDVALWSYASGATGITQISGGNMIVELAAGDSISTRVRSGEPNVSVYMGHSCFLGYLIG
jgi:hypothetical protein